MEDPPPTAGAEAPASGGASFEEEDGQQVLSTDEVSTPPWLHELEDQSRWEGSEQVRAGKDHPHLSSRTLPTLVQLAAFAARLAPTAARARSVKKGIRCFFACEAVGQ